MAFKTNYVQMKYGRIDSNVYYQRFIASLQNKIPHKATLVNTIADILAIDKDAVYRRLRGDVSFSFLEMSNIAKSIGISLDKIAGIENTQSRPSEMNIINHINPSEIDYEMFEEHVNIFKTIKDDPNSKIMDASNIFPYFLYYDYEYLTRYHIFRWNNVGISGNILPYHEISIPVRLRALQKELCTYAKQISSTLYILNSHIFERIVSNIKYFFRIRLINESDVSMIKNDLMAFLNMMEKLAVTGKHRETGKEVFIYISDLASDANYCCLKSKKDNVTIFKTFIANETVTFDVEVFNSASAWIYSIQRTSTLISVSGEKFRAEYFDNQKEIILSL